MHEREKNRRGAARNSNPFGHHTVPDAEPVVTRTPDSAPGDRLWNQREAAAYLGLSTRYLRDSNCPKILLPGNGRRGQHIVRYSPADVRAWAFRWKTLQPKVERIA